MKKLLSTVLAMMMLLTMLPVGASAVEVDAPVAEPASVQPRLNLQDTYQLGNAWTNIKVESNWLTATLTVVNIATSSHAVMIRIVDNDYKIIKEAVSIEPGKSEKFYSIPFGGYIIQGKSKDDAVHTYELHCYD